jgi:hypothetical protein
MCFDAVLSDRVYWAYLFYADDHITIPYHVSCVLTDDPDQGPYV